MKKPSEIAAGVLAKETGKDHARSISRLLSTIDEARFLVSTEEDFKGADFWLQKAIEVATRLDKE